jgi:hypothetical protein
MICVEAAGQESSVASFDVYWIAEAFLKHIWFGRALSVRRKSGVNASFGMHMAPQLLSFGVAKIG